MLEEITHTHNEAVKSIDVKINKLIQTLDYLGGCSAPDKDITEAYLRVKSLHKSKELLLSFTDSEQLIEPKANRNKSRMRVVDVFDKEGEFLYQCESVQVASKKTGVHESGIFLLANGIQKKCKQGYIFEYAKKV